MLISLAEKQEQSSEPGEMHVLTCLGSRFALKRCSLSLSSLFLNSDYTIVGKLTDEPKVKHNWNN